MGLFGKKSSDLVRGTARVLSSSVASSNVMYAPLHMTLVVEADGMPARSVEFRKKAARTTKFPFRVRSSPSRWTVMILIGYR